MLNVIQYPFVTPYLNVCRQLTNCGFNGVSPLYQFLLYGKLGEWPIITASSTETLTVEPSAANRYLQGVTILPPSA